MKTHTLGLPVFQQEYRDSLLERERERDLTPHHISSVWCGNIIITQFSLALKKWNQKSKIELWLITRQIMICQWMGREGGLLIKTSSAYGLYARLYNQ